eukprot:6814141-Karenia_brevis.AAC.1
MDLPDKNNICVRHPSGKIFCSKCCHDKFVKGETPTPPSKEVQKYLEQQDKRNNNALRLYQVHMERQ